MPASNFSASLVADIVPGPDSSSPSFLTNVNGTLFFSTVDPTTGSPALWKSDGTTAGTVLVSSHGGSEYTPFNGSVYFSAGGLWKTDGTAAGTVLVSSVDARELTVVDGKLFFRGTTSTDGSELWVSDGSTAGTVLVKDLNPGSTTHWIQPRFGHRVKVTSVNSSTPLSLTDLNGRLMFSASDGSHGRQLWVSDGTAQGTTMLTSSPKELRPQEFVVANGALYFGTAGSGGTGMGLWMSDGTAAGTVMIHPFVYATSAETINTGDRGDPVITSVNSTVYFVADDGHSGPELWKSDGTAKGTVLVKDINPGASGSDPVALTSVNGVLYFAASDGVHGEELWKSDGTTAGTVMVQDINPGGADAFDYWHLHGEASFWFTNVNGLLYFTADDGTHGTELWQSNGTAAGTVMVREIYPGAGPDGVPLSSNPSFLVAMNDKLYFTATDPVHGTELWDPPPVRNRRAGAKMTLFSNIQSQVSNLGGTTLGVAEGHTIWLDDKNAAAWGWFVDRARRDDSEFKSPANQGAKRRIDLLAVLEHELRPTLGDAKALKGEAVVHVTDHEPRIAVYDTFADERNDGTSP